MTEDRAGKHHRSSHVTVHHPPPNSQFDIRISPMVFNTELPEASMSGNRQEGSRKHGHRTGHPNSDSMTPVCRSDSIAKLPIATEPNHFFCHDENNHGFMGIEAMDLYCRRDSRPTCSEPMDDSQPTIPLSRTRGIGSYAGRSGQRMACTSHVEGECIEQFAPTRVRVESRGVPQLSAQHDTRCRSRARDRGRHRGPREPTRIHGTQAHANHRRIGGDRTGVARTR